MADPTARVLLALAVGMALSVCGVVMQAIVQNPLADPYVLGISSGASLGATLAIMLGIGSFLGGNSVGVTAFIGAMITSFAVIAIANMGGKATSAKLILAGMAVSAVCSAFSNFVIYITNDKNAATEVMKWSMGSLAGGKLGQSRCDASGYSDMCGHLLDTVSKPESDAFGR